MAPKRAWVLLWFVIGQWGYPLELARAAETDGPPRTACNFKAKTWTGGCKDDVPHGFGELSDPKSSFRAKGAYVAGVAAGSWDLSNGKAIKRTLYLDGRARSYLQHTIGKDNYELAIRPKVDSEWIFVTTANPRKSTVPVVALNDPKDDADLIYEFPLDTKFLVDASFDDKANERVVAVVGSSMEEAAPLLAYIKSAALYAVSRSDAAYPTIIKLQAAPPIPNPYTKFGINDPRKVVTGRQDPPFDAIAQVEVLDSSNELIGGCTGWIAYRPTLAVTAAHCLNRYPDRASVFVRFRHTGEPNDTGERIRAHIVETGWGEIAGVNDWALLRLDRAPSHKIVPLSLVDDRAFHSDRIAAMAVGFSADTYPRSEMVASPCWISFREDIAFIGSNLGRDLPDISTRSDCLTTHGVSGGPLVVGDARGGFAVLGLVAAGGESAIDQLRSLGALTEGLSNDIRSVRDKLPTIDEYGSKQYDALLFGGGLATLEAELSVGLSKALDRESRSALSKNWQDRALIRYLGMMKETDDAGELHLSTLSAIADWCTSNCKDSGVFSALQRAKIQVGRVFPEALSKGGVELTFEMIYEMERPYVEIGNEFREQREKILEGVMSGIKEFYEGAKASAEMRRKYDESEDKYRAGATRSFTKEQLRKMRFVVVGGNLVAIDRTGGHVRAVRTDFVGDCWQKACMAMRVPEETLVSYR